MKERKKKKFRGNREGLFLTPLIDIIFILVLFFIVNTSFRQERYIDVSLPESSTSADKQSEGIILTLRADGTILLDGEDISWDELTNAVINKSRSMQVPEVVIRGDENISYGKAVAALDRVRQAGINAVTLQTLRSSGE
jgi:biopolymer transport protein ExbD